MTKKYHNWYKGVHISHPKEIGPVFEKFLKDFDTIIEIGTYVGGLTIWMRDKTNAKILTYDLINPSQRTDTDVIPDVNNVFKSNNIDFFLGSCFDMEAKIADQIKKGKRCLLLCDGGDKIKEFQTFSKHLKPSDVIMAHDYAETGVEFDQHASRLGWKFDYEIAIDHIEDLIKEQELKKYEYHTELKHVFWGAWIK